MEKSEFNKVVNYIEGSFGRTLSQNELLVLGKELKDYPYEKFDKEVKDVLLKISYFTVAELHRILENIRVSEQFLERSGRKSWEEFYENADILFPKS